MPLSNFISILRELFQRRQVNFNSFHILNIRNYLIYEITHISIEYYVIYFPRMIKRLIEFIILFMAVSSLFLLVFVHINFMQFPSNCVNQIKNNWPRDGILQVVIHQPTNQRLSTNYENIIYRNYFAEMNNPKNIDEVDNETIEKFVWEDKYGENNISRTNFLLYYLSPIMKANIKCTIHYDKGIIKNIIEKSNIDIVKSHFSLINESIQCFESPNSCINKVISEANKNLFIQSTKYTTNIAYEQYKAKFYKTNFEYSLEDGYLYLSSNTRRKLGIPVMTVLLEPSGHNMSFGNYIGMFTFKFFVSYEHYLMSTLETIASEEGKKGSMRNVITNIIHYIFYKSSKLWYISSFIMMFLFSLMMSVSVKYIYHQIYFCIMNSFRIFNTEDGTFLITVAKLFSNSLVLHGVGVIMFNLFSINDMSYYLILLSLIADQYYVICSRNVLTKKYWLKFFYLYHFALYAHHCQFRHKHFNLALICLYLFVLHSMIYFFHHYEMPLIVADIENWEHDEEEEEESNLLQQSREPDLVVENIRISTEDMQTPEDEQLEEQQQFYMEDDQQMTTESDNQSSDDSLVVTESI